MQKNTYLRELKLLPYSGCRYTYSPDCRTNLMSWTVAIVHSPLRTQPCPLFSDELRAWCHPKRPEHLRYAPYLPLRCYEAPVVGYSGIFVLKEKNSLCSIYFWRKQKNQNCNMNVIQLRPDSCQPSWFCLYTKNPKHLPAYEFHSD